MTGNECYYVPPTALCRNEIGLKIGYRVTQHFASEKYRSETQIVILASKLEVSTSEQRIVHAMRTKAHCRMKERLSEPAAKLRRFAAVAFEKSTKSLFASNFGERDCRRLIHLRFGLSLSGFRLADQFVVQALVRSFFVVVDFELLAQDIHVLVSKDDEMIETFLLDRLDEPFGEGDHVRRTDRRPLCLNLSLFQGRNERLRVLPVIIQHQNLAFRAFRLDRLNELCRLPNHPLFIRLVGRRRNIDSTSFDVDEDQNKDIAKPRFRDDLLRKEIALPQRLRMSSHKLIPSSRTTFRPNIKAVTFQNRFDRIASNRRDTEFPKFAKNSGVSPTVVLSKLENQLFQFRLGSRPSRFLGFRFPLATRLVRFTNPLSKSIRMNNGAEMVQSGTKPATKPNQSVLLSFGQLDAFRQSRSQKLVLGFEKADVPSQFFVRRLGQNEQKSGVDVTEVGHREKCSRSRKTLGGRNFCTPLEGPRLVTRKSKSTERARTNAHG